MSTKSFSIIGTGNMGSSIAKGLKESGIHASSISLCDIDSKKLNEFSSQGFAVSTEASEAIKNAAYIFIVVKPYLVKDLLQTLKGKIREDQVIISVAAGIGSELIINETNKKQPVFIAIPNTAIAIRESVTALSSVNAGQEEIENVMALFNKMGETIYLDEKLIPAATILGSCGIAYALRFIRATMLAGTEIGLKPELSRTIAAQIAKGAAEIILQGTTNPEDEIDKVTTPKGLTIAGLNEMEKNGFSAALIKGFTEAFRKIDGK